MDATVFRDVKALGQQLRQTRKAKGWSQSDLAERAGTDPRQISRIETAAHEPQLSLLLAVVAALEMVLGLVPRRGASSQTAQPKPENIF